VKISAITIIWHHFWDSINCFDTIYRDQHRLYLPEKVKQKSKGFRVMSLLIEEAHNTDK
jgi:hypothetical protein